MMQRTANLGGAALVVLLGLFLLSEARAFSDMGALMPNLIAGLLIALGLGIAGAELWRPALVPVRRAALAGWVRPLAFMGLFALLLATLPLLGFLPAVVIVGVAVAELVPRTGEPRRVSRSLLHAGFIVAAATCLWLLLTAGLNVPLPSAGRL